MLAQEQMVINWLQINLGWKLEESPNQQSREVLEQLSSWSSSRQNRTAVKMVVDNYMKYFLSYACAKKTLAGKRRSFPVLLALQCLSVPPQAPQGPCQIISSLRVQGHQPLQCRGKALIREGPSSSSRSLSQGKPK